MNPNLRVLAEDGSIHEFPAGTQANVIANTLARYRAGQGHSGATVAVPGFAPVSAPNPNPLIGRPSASPPPVTNAMPGGWPSAPTQTDPSFPGPLGTQLQTATPFGMFGRPLPMPPVSVNGSSAPATLTGPTALQLAMTKRAATIPDRADKQPPTSLATNLPMRGGSKFPIQRQAAGTPVAQSFLGNAWPMPALTTQPSGIQPALQQQASDSGSDLRLGPLLDGLNTIDRTYEIPAPRASIGPVPRYPETGQNAWRGSNDLVFQNAVNAYNMRYGYLPGDPGYITPEFVKAWSMRESGGDKQAFATDPLQVNAPGDYPKPDEPGELSPKLVQAGLTKGQIMTPAISAAAALDWLRFKGHIRDPHGIPGPYIGDYAALHRYAGKDKDAYATQVTTDADQMLQDEGK